MPENLPHNEGQQPNQQYIVNVADITQYREGSNPVNTQTFAPGKTIIAEGTYGSQTYLIKSGKVLICKETGRKGRISIATLGEGEVFGEMYLLDDAGFRSASVIAQTEVTVEVIPKEEMEQYLKETHPIVLSMMKTLSTRLAQTSQENSILKFQGNPNPLKHLSKLLCGQ